MTATRGGVPAETSDVSALVTRYGLERPGARPTLPTYTRRIWERRRFIWTFATASTAVGYSRSFLGQAWQLLTPLLNVMVYYLIFGVLLHTSRGIPNFIAYLVIGLTIFSYISTSMTMGARSIQGHLRLTRAIHFPRAALPIATTLVALQRLMYSLMVMVPIVLITGERPGLAWLLLVPALGLQTLFCLGVALIMARVGAHVPDTSQMLPFLLRIWLYTSGIFWSVQQFTKGRPGWVKFLLDINPGRVYVDIVRNALLANPVSRSEWPLAVGWAILALVVGYLYFWRAEESYGRV